jgi:hypothetical protein
LFSTNISVDNHLPNFYRFFEICDFSDFAILLAFCGFYHKKRRSLGHKLRFNATRGFGLTKWIYYIILSQTSQHLPYAKSAISSPRKKYPAQYPYKFLKKGKQPPEK